MNKTNEQGKFTVNLPDGSYNYSLVKGGFSTVSGNFTVSGSPININRTMFSQELVLGKLQLRGFAINDIFTQEVYDYYDTNEINNADDYTNKIYIDPDFTGISDGSVTHPYKGLADVPQQGDTAYLIKRGTHHEIPASYGNFNFYGENIIICAYGEGVRPTIQGANLRFGNNYATIRDIEFLSHSPAFTNTNSLAHFGTIFNVKCSGIWTFSRNTRFIGCEISGSGSNGIFVQQWDLSVDQHVEIAYCHIYEVNQSWHPDEEGGEPKGQWDAFGDGIQFSTYRGTYHIHNCIVDRSDTGNKFCVIVNAHTNGGHMITGIIENNIMYGPQSYPDGGAIIYLGNVVGENLPSPSAFHTCTIRKNRLIGSYSPMGDNWTGACLYANSTLMYVYGNLLKDTDYGGLIGSYQGQSEFYNNTVTGIKGSNQVMRGTIHHMHNNILPNTNNTTPQTSSGNNIILTTHSPADVFHDLDTEDYRLKAGSPAIDYGTWQAYMSAEYNEDMRGVAIPQNNNIDAGALQYEE